MPGTRVSDDPIAIREQVKKAYAGRLQGGGCCGSGAGEPSGDSIAEAAAIKMGYTTEDLGQVPEGSNLGMGCGAPLAIADPKPGETVLDLGSGAGFDAFLAARKVGSGGRVIGVDMTPEMVARARRTAAESRVENVEFREGLIEDLPVESSSIDVIVSNCVINLSPDKGAVFRESFRVLRPGGRMVVSDIALAAPLPEAITKSIEAYVGCVAGAVAIDEYLRFIARAGFEEIEVVSSVPAVEALSAEDPVIQGLLADVGIGCLDDLEEHLKELAGRVRSVKVAARKPAD